MNTTPPELPPMTEKVRAAIVKKLNLCKQYGYVTLSPEKEYDILCAAMAAYDAIRESLAQSPPAPPAAAPDVDVEELAKIIYIPMMDRVASDKCTFLGNTPNADKARSIARAAIEYCKGKTAPLRVDREKVAIAIEATDGEDAIDRSGWDDYLYAKRMRQADAAIAAMEYCKKKFAPLRADREKVISEISKIYYDGTLDGERVNRVELMAEAAISAMCASKEYDGSYDAEIAELKKERDAARAQCAEMLIEIDALYHREAAFCELASKAPVTRKVYQIEPLAAAAKDGAK